MTKTMTNTNDNHSKFYRLTLDRKAKTVTIRYGRIGSAGQTATMRFDYVDSAIAFFWNKFNAKLGRGYEEVAHV